MTLPVAEDPILWGFKAQANPQGYDMEIRPDVLKNQECYGSIAEILLPCSYSDPILVSGPSFFRRPSWRTAKEACDFFHGILNYPWNSPRCPHFLLSPHCFFPLWPQAFLMKQKVRGGSLRTREGQKEVCRLRCHGRASAKWL